MTTLSSGLLALLTDLGDVPGVGIDVEPVSRFQMPDPRLFTPAELTHASGVGEPAQSRAGCWCAKEAVVKACALHMQLSVREVEIAHEASGRPVVRLPPRAVAAGLRAEVSIAHTGELAVAVAIASCTG